MGEREPGATRLAAMAKRLATDAGFEIVNGCLQLHGGYGYLRDHPIERVLRDVRVHQILEGTNEIMRLIISRACRKLTGSNALIRAREMIARRPLRTLAMAGRPKSCSSSAVPPASSR